MSIAPSKPGPATVSLLYLAVANAFTWPLLPGIARDIPWDLGDSLLNAWILAWDADHLLRFLSGEASALRGFWNANIFHPEPLTLAYSEHLVAQAIQILPVYALTHNIILSYNLLFLSTFVLSGLGMYLFVREVTGSVRAGALAGFAYAFAPYRVPQFAHVQVLSSQWMPFVLYGLRRYFETRRPKPLVGAGAALIAQNLSNGYFLLFFSPFVLAYALFEITVRRLWKDLRVWTALGTTAVVVSLVTVPFLLPYAELRRLGFGPRTLNEVRAFSADVFSYWTSPAESHIWGDVARAYPKAEGDLFLGLTVIVLAAIAVWFTATRAWASTRDVQGSPAALRPVVYVLCGLCAVYAVFLVLILTGNGFTHLGPLPVSVRNLWRNFRILAIFAALLLAISARARAAARHMASAIGGFAALAAIVAALLSFGPEIRADGRLISEVGPYDFLYRHVAGFDGLRVPARYAMIVVLFVSVAAGMGVAALERRTRRAAVLVWVLSIAIVAESLAAPIMVNGTAAESLYATPPNRVFTGNEIPAVYRHVKSLDAPGIVLVEFPFGEWTYELRYVFYSINHWRPLLNGYSGHFPLSYNMRATYLRHPMDLPDFAWRELQKSGATHAIVHGPFYKDDEGERIAAWLVANGARHAGDFDGDRLFVLR